MFVLKHWHGVLFNADAIFALDDAIPDTPLNEDQVEFITKTNPQLTNWETVVVGGFAKLVATIFTYPIQVFSS